MKRIRSAQTLQDQPNPTALPVDRPPPDYAAKTTEGISNAHWSN
jgi:hypothetical protein